jgi:hypothetical protein
LGKRIDAAQLLSTTKFATEFGPALAETLASKKFDEARDSGEIKRRALPRCPFLIIARLLTIYRPLSHQARLSDGKYEANPRSTGPSAL